MLANDAQFSNFHAIKLLKIMSGNKARISPVMSESVLLETLETLGELPVLILSVGTNSASFIRKVKKYIQVRTLLYTNI